jgi:hypothetical protein
MNFPIIIQNQLILFPSLWNHRGCAPIEKNTPRITLAFKTKKLNKLLLNFIKY